MYEDWTCCPSPPVTQGARAGPLEANDVESLGHLGQERESRERRGEEGSGRGGERRRGTRGAKGGEAKGVSVHVVRPLELGNTTVTCLHCGPIKARIIFEDLPQPNQANILLTWLLNALCQGVAVMCRAGAMDGTRGAFLCQPLPAFSSVFLSKEVFRMQTQELLSSHSAGDVAGAIGSPMMPCLDP